MTEIGTVTQVREKHISRGAGGQPRTHPKRRDSAASSRDRVRYGWTYIDGIWYGKTYGE